MELPGQRISMEARPWLNSFILPIFTILLIFGPLVAFNIGSYGIVDWVVISGIAALCLFVMLVLGRSLFGSFAEGSIVEEGLWLSDGKSKHLYPWAEVVSLVAAIPIPGQGWPALIVMVANQKNPYRLMLKIDKKQSWSMDPKDYSDIMAVAAK